MIIAGIYSFKQGREIIEEKYKAELQEVLGVSASVESNLHKSKVSEEKTMSGRMLYNPRSLNVAFKTGFAHQDWISQRVICDYPTEFYTADYQPATVLLEHFER